MDRKPSSPAAFFRRQRGQVYILVNGAFTTYFNVKRARPGHLFQGRYKAILVEINEYAKELLRYIHLNPVRAKMVKTQEEYGYPTRFQFISTVLNPV